MTNRNANTNNNNETNLQSSHLGPVKPVWHWHVKPPHVPGVSIHKAPLEQGLAAHPAAIAVEKRSKLLLNMIPYHVRELTNQLG